jgi:hypothetical protein
MSRAWLASRMVIVRSHRWRRQSSAAALSAIQGTIDPHRRAVLTNLQKLWIALANERGFLTDEQVAD